ncbi:MAG: carboxyl transferase domain-containing protein, partial [Myxococcota bacterium]|nr:carboxyl transferase domain-containing protein [Myxococcota bacterium]
GGGRGIRVVQEPGALAAAFESASAEALAAFGDGRLFLERRADAARHVEVQVVADAHGTVWTLGARDCSVQRRHQKVLEETPPPGLAPETVGALEAAAARLAAQVGYTGVGTVEFLVRGDAFWFLEVNPRLQVEHGITEELYGFDLVHAQIRIARGEPLGSTPPVAGRVGHAIEARVCAEDPEADHLPAPGRVVRFEPALGPGVRVDTGVASGVSVPPDFDSLIAKVIATGATREQARARLVAALADFELVVAGGATNKGALLELLEAPDFRAGGVDTGWLDRGGAGRPAVAPLAVEALLAAAVISYRDARALARRRFFADPTHPTRERIPGSEGLRVVLSRGAARHELRVYAVDATSYRVDQNGRSIVVGWRQDGADGAILSCGGRSHHVLYDASGPGLRIEVDGRPHRFGDESAGQLRAAAPGVVISIDVAPGDRVEAGAAVGVVEAMKMEAALCAPVGGVVREVHARAGLQVAAGDLLLVIDASEGEATGPRDAPLALPELPNPLDLLLGGGDDPLATAARAPADEWRAAVAALRAELRRIWLGWDVDARRVDRVAALLEAPVTAELSEALRWGLAELRHELAVVADVEQLFVRAPRYSVSGELGASNHTQLRGFLRRLRTGGAGSDPEFLALLGKALAHYGVHDLEASEDLERAVLRLLSVQLESGARHRLVLAAVRHVQALARTGIHLGDDRPLEEALRRLAGMRGRVSNALADAALEAAYAIFERPIVEAEARRTAKEVEAWLAAAEHIPTPPPAEVLLHLAEAPAAVFERVRPWLLDDDELRRSLAVVAHLRRLYAPCLATVHSSAVLRGVSVERIELADRRVVIGTAAIPGELARALDCLARGARAAALDRAEPCVHALELLVPVADAAAAEAACEHVRAELADPLGEDLFSERVHVSLVPPSGPATNLVYERGDEGLVERTDLHGLHAETAARIDLGRLAGFELERLTGREDLHVFHLRHREVEGDERLFVLADVRGRSPDGGAEASLHLPAFERAFFEATRALRRALRRRDPQRRMHWNRIALFAAPPVFLERDTVAGISRRLAPATRHLGLEKVVVRLRVLDRDAPAAPPRELEIVIADPTGSRMEIEWRRPHHELLHPASDYERRVVSARRRGHVYPYEIVRMLTGAGRGGADASAAAADDTALPPATFEEYDLDPEAPRPVAVSAGGRPYGENRSGVVFGIITSITDKAPEGMRRVLVLSDPTRGMGSLAAPECDRLVAAIDLAEQLGLPVEWVPVSSGARIEMQSGTENLDATARVVRRIVTFTRAGGVIHVIVHGVNVGAQSYFDALATMLQHTRGALIMTPGGSMVLTGRAALEASGAIAAEDETGIGGFERVMGPNGEAQYYARDLHDAYRILYAHYRFSYVAPGEVGPRPHPTRDPAERAVTGFATEPEEGHEFESVGGIFDAERNRERKRPFAMRQLMRAVVDADGGHLERWRSWAGAQTAVVWDAHLGGHAVTLVGIESRNLPREGHRPGDGPAEWTGGTLFPLSSRKVARALDAASGNRPVVVLANLSGFDGSPESLRRLQLEYGAEIARAVVEFSGPLLFTVVSRYHGGAYVVFSRALNDELRAFALEGSFASVIGGSAAAKVVLQREVRARAAADPRAERLRAEAAAAGDPDATWQELLLEKQAELAAEFDAVHSVERAREVGSVEQILAPARLRPHLIAALDGARGKAR